MRTTHGLAFVLFVPCHVERSEAQSKHLLLQIVRDSSTSLGMTKGRTPRLVLKPPRSVGGALQKVRRPIRLHSVQAPRFGYNLLAGLVIAGPTVLTTRVWRLRFSSFVMLSGAKRSRNISYCKLVRFLDFARNDKRTNAATGSVAAPLCRGALQKVRRHILLRSWPAPRRDYSVQITRLCRLCFS
ncbi:MAG: hypothetical protein QOI96_2010 [Verrucomicrobiota bacterium]|jgi:hypothetical protein